MVLSIRSSGQRDKYFNQFAPSYFDSIRVMVNDTAREHYTINAYRLTGMDEIVIDGNLKEPAWQNAERRGGLLEKEPYPLIPMSEKTEFAILYDDENLYIGVWCWDSEPRRIVQQLAPRGTSAPDHLMFFIDSYHDHRTGYKFVVSPTGVQADELRYDDIKRDGNWNGIWYSEGSVDEKGWYAEVKIPFFNFRFSGETDQTWGFNIMRNVSRNASRGQWKPHLPEWDNTTRMSQLGHIYNISNIRSGREFELRPYSIASLSETIDRNPFSSAGFGGDIRYSPSSSLTADFTINPDFAQVDADIYEINLTRYPTRFRELRPFFTERINIFNTPLELFYSRRIGAKGDILGGVKMSGKLQHGIEFGILGNLTGKSLFTGSVPNGENAIYGVVRVKKDISGTGSLGILAATREGEGNYNRTYGLDGSFMLSGNDILDFQIATGEAEQGGSENNAYLLSYLRTGDLMGFTFDFNRAEPAFEINRVGYIRKEPDRGWNRWSGLFRISPRINKYHVRRITVTLGYENNRDLFTSEYIVRWLENYPDILPAREFGTVGITDAGERTIAGGIREAGNFKTGGDLSIQLMNEMSLSSDLRYFSATELTGGYSGNFFKTSFASRPLSLGTQFAGVLSVSGGTWYNFARKHPGTQNTVSAEGEGRFFSRFLTKLTGEYTKTYDPLDNPDGNYYKLSANSTWMFTKDLFLRLHAQGLFGSTVYEERELFNEYLLSCLVSWEYRPGSFLYLAYNENRFDETTSVTKRYMQLNNRTLLVKISYFFHI